MLKAGTFCSGVLAPEVAMKEFIDFLWCCEFDKFPSAVIAHRMPGLHNIGDMLNRNQDETYLKSFVDLIIAGTPCQGFSVAGLRGGLGNDKRAQLTIEFVRALREKLPKWFIWENVPGVFSSWSDAKDCREGEKEIGETWECDQTNDFETFISEVQKLGYGICWRILDAQHFGVPQRRRRVFVVGYLGDWRPPYRVLFEPEGLRGDIEKSESKGKGTAGEAKNSFGETVSGGAVFPTLTAAQGSKQWLGNQEAFSGDYFIKQDKELIVHGTQDPCVSNKAFYLGRNNGGENALLQKAATEDENNKYYEREIYRAEHCCNQCDCGQYDERFDNFCSEYVDVGYCPEKIGEVHENLQRRTNDEVKAVHENQRAEVSLNDTVGSLKTGGGKPGQGYPCLFRYSKSHRDTHVDQRIYSDGTTNTLNTGDGCSNQSTQNVVCESIRLAQTGSNGQAVRDHGSIVRKLTPLECERLQGFPDNWTKIPYRGKDKDQCPKGARYKAMGNSMAVPVMKWIGERLNWVDQNLSVEEKILRENLMSRVDTMMELDYLFDYNGENIGE